MILPVQSDTNSSNRWFARAAVRWQPADAVDLEISYLHQQINVNNSSYANPGFSGSSFDLTAPVAGPVTADNPSLDPNSAFNIPAGGKYTSTAFALSPYADRIDLVSAVASIDFGLATLTSASSYHNDRSVGTSDFTGVYDNPAFRRGGANGVPTARSGTSPAPGPVVCN